MDVGTRVLLAVSLESDNGCPILLGDLGEGDLFGWDCRSVLGERGETQKEQKGGDLRLHCEQVGN